MRCFGLFYQMQSDNPSDEEMLKKLGARIRALRIREGYSNYEKFANKHEINRSQVWRYENGENLTFTTLVRLARAFNINLADFFSEGFED
jgi:transcriptional regulator with XRE-family HTH domain